MSFTFILGILDYYIIRAQVSEKVIKEWTVYKLQK